MATPFPPSTIKAYQYSSTKGGLDKNLEVNHSALLPKPKPDQHLIQVIAIALNPVDYKPAEVPLVGQFIVPKPATPGIDFAGCIVTPATGLSLKRSQLVFGVAGTTPFAGGALSEFTLAEKEGTVALPNSVDPIDAATISIAGLTAYQSIVPKVKKGDKVFINSGSGGTGVFGIQIAKALGCHVTTTCSTANVELCRSLGADDILDYKNKTIVKALKASKHKFDYVVDNVGADLKLYWRCHKYTEPQAVYVMPAFLGGAKRKHMGFFAKLKYEELKQIRAWMKEGKVKAIIDQRFPFEQAPKAFEKLKTGRAKGKIVVDVASDTYGEA
ncbi:hypothetical protein LTR66_007736 [Elasticomyces elasticus]|nr:hypothetical protein LTR66_007736 [Elasticomyces elasticus]